METGTGRMDVKARKVYLDVAKGLAILLVILGHMNRFFSYQGGKFLEPRKCTDITQFQIWILAGDPQQ